MPGYQCILINPRRICEGYDNYFVCLSATKLAATYPVYESQLQCYKTPYGIMNA